MTQEEKAKAYDEAIAKAQKELQTCGSRDCDAARQIYRLFHELAESEDERIRKEIISHLQHEYVVKRYVSDVEYDRWIAWLEKQEGCEYIKKDWLEHIKQSWYKEGFIDGKYSGGTSKEWTINDAATLKELIDFLENGTAKLQHDLTRYANWLKNQFTLIEKQGEQKLSNSAKIGKNDTLLDLLHKIPSHITVDGIEYNFVLKKTVIYMAYYEGEGEEGRDKTIFWIAGNPIDLLTEMLDKLKKEGLLE